MPFRQSVAKQVPIWPANKRKISAGVNPLEFSVKSIRWQSHHLWFHLPELAVNLEQ